MDIDRDGDIDSTDQTLCGTSYIAALPKGQLSTPGPGSGGGVDNLVGWCGYLYDQPIKVYCVRFRYYDPGTFRWLNRDPAGYVDSMNLYGYGVGHAVFETDPFGLQGDPENPSYPGNPSFAWGVTLEGEQIDFDPSQFITDEHLDALYGAQIDALFWGEFWKALGEQLLDPLVILDLILTFVPGGKLLSLAAKGLARLYRAYKAGVAAGRCKLWLWCFAAGTLVWTAEGQVPIEEIEAGDLVWSLDADTGDWELREVIAPSESEYHGETVAIDIVSNDGSLDAIDVTGGHPFWVTSGHELDSRPHVADWPEGETLPTLTGRWVEARHLRLGDHFLTRSGKSATVVGLTIRIERTAVYNLEVVGTHTYAVGGHGVVVHNTCAGMHHFFMKAFGNPLRKGTQFLDAVTHTRLHNVLNAFLRTKSMLPVRGRPGTQIVRELGQDAVYEAFDEFYRFYEDGKYYFQFIEETFRFRCGGSI